MRAGDEPPLSREHHFRAAAERLRRALTEITLAAANLRGAPAFGETNPPEYYALNRLWVEAEALARQLETKGHK